MNLFLMSNIAEAPVQFFGSDILTAVLFLVAALVLVFLEMLIISFGVLTLFAMLAGGAALLSAFSVSVVTGWVFVVIALIGTPIVIMLSMRLLKKTSMVLKDDCTDVGVTGEAEAIATGARGRTITALRPVGSAIFNGEKIGVQSMGEMIAKETEVEVVSTSGNRILVKVVST